MDWGDLSHGDSTYEPDRDRRGQKIRSLVSWRAARRPDARHVSDTQLTRGSRNVSHVTAQKKCQAKNVNDTPPPLPRTRPQSTLCDHTSSGQLYTSPAHARAAARASHLG